MPCRRVGVEAARQLEVRARGIDGLRLQRRHARVGHHVHAGRQARLGIARGRQAVLGDERADAEVLCVKYFVFATGRGRRYTDTVGCGDCKP